MRFAYRDGMLLFTLCTLAVGLAGCGSAGDPEVVRVSGTGRPSGAMTDEQGHYELNYTGDQKGARIGPNRVQITTAQGPTETMDGKPIPAVRETVPARYNARTELEFTVTEQGSNVADFELSSK